MATVSVHAPVQGYSGVSAGVVFTDGVGEVDTADRSALTYFRRAGYSIGTPIQEHPGTGEPMEAIEVSVDEEVELVERPAKSARKAAWVDFAVACGMDRSEAEQNTRDALVERFGG